MKRGSQRKMFPLGNYLHGIRVTFLPVGYFVQDRHELLLRYPSLGPHSLVGRDYESKVGRERGGGKYFSLVFHLPVDSMRNGSYLRLYC